MFSDGILIRLAGSIGVVELHIDFTDICKSVLDFFLYSSFVNSCFHEVCQLGSKLIFFLLGMRKDAFHEVEERNESRALKARSSNQRTESSLTKLLKAYLFRGF